MTTILQPIGRTFLNGLAAMGRLTLFALVAVRHCLTPPFYPRLLLRQMIEIGYYSLPYVGMTAVFTGMVLVLQTYTGFNVNAEGLMPQIVVLSLTRELGPVLAALIVAGRIGASMAAEIGTMRVTEQILGRAALHGSARDQLLRRAVGLLQLTRSLSARNLRDY